MAWISSWISFSFNSCVRSSIVQLLAGSPNNFDSILISIKSSTEKYWDHLMEIQLKKYKHDTEDYLRNEVYPWDMTPVVTTSNISGSETQKNWNLSSPFMGTTLKKKKCRRGSGASQKSSTTVDSELLKETKINIWSNWCFVQRIVLTSVVNSFCLKVDLFNRFRQIKLRYEV